MATSPDDPSTDELVAPLADIVWTGLVGIAPTALVVYRLLRKEPVPRWVVATAPFSLFLTWMAYLALKLRYDEELRARTYEKYRRYEQEQS